MVLGRLWLCGLFGAVAFGAIDLIAHAPKLRWYEACELLALHALFGGILALLGLPFAWLALVVLRRWLGLGRTAAVLMWGALAVVVLAAFELGTLGRMGALVTLGIVALISARAAALRSFETMTRWRVKGLLSVLLLLGLAIAPQYGRKHAKPADAPAPARSGGRPDVVLVVLDTLRADHLGAYGDPRGLSPAFDAFAKEGSLYENCFSPAPWTVPSHASMFTGKFPPSHGCSFEHHRWLDHDFTTLAEALEKRDYQTAAFCANPYLEQSNLLQGFAVQEPLGERAQRLAIRPLLQLLGWPSRWSDHGAADACERVDAFLARERDPDRPLFLFVNLLEAHWRHLPALGERLEQTRPEPGVLTATGVASEFYGPLVMAGKKLDGPVEPSIRALYAASVAYQDARLGELLATLRQRLDLENAVVAITSDHGENLGDGGRFDHVFAVNDALLHVPLVLRHPKSFPAGARVGGLCQLVDLPGTLFALTNEEQSGDFAEELAGRSLLPSRFAAREVVLGFGDPYYGHLERMSRFAGFNRDVVPFTAVLRSIRDATHQLVRSSVRGEQLFELTTDPAATKDVGADQAAQLQFLRARLDAELAALPGYDGPPLRPPKDRDDPGLDARLLELGYH